jgi:hypothetical protein
MLYWPARLPLSASSRLKGGEIIERLGGVQSVAETQLQNASN